MCIVTMFSMNPVRRHAERQKLEADGNMNQSDSAQVKTLDYIASRVKRKNRIGGLQLSHCGIKTTITSLYPQQKQRKKHFLSDVQLRRYDKVI